MKINKIIVILLVFAAAALLWVFAVRNNTHVKYPVTIISSYQEVLPLIEMVNNNTLVLFDVDDTILTSPDVLARTTDFSWWFKALLLMKFPQLLKAENFEAAYSIVWQQAPRILTEPLVVELINTLKNKGATVLALTSMESGAYGVIENMPLWRYTMLKNMGIEFSNMYANTYFETLPRYRSTYPVLYNGILCANQQNKGKVLAAFLEYSKFKPSSIVSFDDDVHALQSIGKVCEQHAIPCTLINYRAHLPGAWNTKRALQQFDYVIKEHRWVSDAAL